MTVKKIENLLYKEKRKWLYHLALPRKTPLDEMTIRDIEGRISEISLLIREIEQEKKREKEERGALNEVCL